MIHVEHEFSCYICQSRETKHNCVFQKFTTKSNVEKEYKIVHKTLLHKCESVIPYNNHCSCQWTN